MLDSAKFTNKEMGFKTNHALVARLCETISSERILVFI
jgi:hypothetical protein